MDFGWLKNIGNALSGLFGGGGNSGGGSVYQGSAPSSPGASSWFNNIGQSLGSNIGNTASGYGSGGSFGSMPSYGGSYSPTMSSQSFPLGISNFGGSNLTNFNTQGGGSSSGMLGNLSNIFNPQNPSPSPKSGNMMGSILGGMKDFAGSKWAMPVAGLGAMGLSQMFSNPSAPKMPDSYNQFMSMMQGGGTPGMQQAGKFYGDVLSGANPDLYNAATQSYDLDTENMKRQLISQYKSLRPGTDTTTDSTFQRDLNNLLNQRSTGRANILAQVQQGAAQGLGGLGGQQMQGLQSGIEAQLNQLATQWNMSYDQKQALRNAIMGMGAQMVTGPTQLQMMQQMFGKK